MYEHLHEGTWWEEAEKALPRESRVFPIIIYVDETHVTARGSQSAKPVFVQAGELS